MVANMQCQRLSISGISFCGTDIGGFIGEPDGELFVQAIFKMAIFPSIFRGHPSSDQGDKEPGHLQLTRHLSENQLNSDIS